MKRLLVVDDNDMNCIMAKRALSDKYEVFIANSGKEALTFLENETVDLILMDIEMPEMNGKEAASKIKQNEAWSKIPIIFLTADSDPKTEAECLSWGADDFITKPFVPVVMNTRVSRILEVHDLRKDLETQLEKKTHQMEKATQKSLTDALTGLRNRDYLEKKLTELLSEGVKGTFFMIDLDNFKQINDTYGHIVGDKTLQHFANVLRDYAREGDIVCRLAGDEFVTFYPELTERKIAAKKAEGIIKSFGDKMTSLGFGGIVSVSIGIIAAQGGEEFKTLYNKADKSLYYVKNNGKNAYHFYDEHNKKIEEISTVVEYVSNMMEQGLTVKKGPFNVAYDEFKKVYDFVSRNVARKKQKVQVVLFTIHMTNKKAEITLEEVMDRWEEALVNSLRTVDTGTRYSSSQYMMIFLDVDMDNGRIVAERVIQRFLSRNEDIKDDMNVTYDIRTMEPEDVV